MRHRPLTILAAISTLLCIAICVLWRLTALAPASLTLGSANGVHYRLVSEAGKATLEAHGPASTVSGSSISVEYILAVWLLVIPPAIWILRTRDLGKPRPGRCEFCGYDLRATPDQCPECGRAPAAARKNDQEP